MCQFRTSAIHLHVKQNWMKAVKKNYFIHRLNGRTQCQRVHSNDFPALKDLLTLTILLHDVDIVNGYKMRELSRRSVSK